MMPLYEKKTIAPKQTHAERHFTTPHSTAQHHTTAHRRLARKLRKLFAQQKKLFRRKIFGAFRFLRAVLLRTNTNPWGNEKGEKAAFSRTQKGAGRRRAQTILVVV